MTPQAIENNNNNWFQFVIESDPKLEFQYLTTRYFILVSFQFFITVMYPYQNPSLPVCYSFRISLCSHLVRLMGILVHSNNSEVPIHRYVRGSVYFDPVVTNISVGTWISESALWIPTYQLFFSIWCEWSGQLLHLNTNIRDWSCTSTQRCY